MDAARSVPPVADRSASNAGGRVLAVVVVLGGGLLAFATGPFLIWLVREQLHIACGMGQPGSEGADTWTCADGVGYIGVAVTLGGMWFVAIVLGSLIAGLVRHERPARISLVLLAIVATTWIIGWTWYGSSELVVDDYAPMSGTAYWAQAVGPAAVVSGIALLVAVVSLPFTGRRGRILCASGVVGLILATIVQPGLGLNLLPAAGLLAAASIRTTTGTGDGEVRS